jgi:predicted transcriptional regulator
VSSVEDFREIRAAKNESLFREINEQIEGLNQSYAQVSPAAEWICECADSTCTAKLAMSIPEYEAIRAHGDRFPVLPGHEIAGIERVVEIHPAYLVVEKTGLAGVIARDADPRN